MGFRLSCMANRPKERTYLFKNATILYGARNCYHNTKYVPGEVDEQAKKEVELFWSSIF
jgi:hypothetical protein